jgi:hypothetical protein
MKCIPHWYWLCDAHFNGNKTGFVIMLIVGAIVLPAAIVWLASLMNKNVR